MFVWGVFFWGSSPQKKLDLCPPPEVVKKSHSPHKCDTKLGGIKQKLFFLEPPTGTNGNHQFSPQPRPRHRAPMWTKSSETLWLVLALVSMWMMPLSPAYACASCGGRRGFDTPMIRRTYTLHTSCPLAFTRRKKYRRNLQAGPRE